jgi:predicted nucleic acid-binding protein
MALSKKVFVTGSVLYAFVDRANARHPQATAYFRFFAQEKYHVYTSYLDIEEAYRAIYIKISPSLARDFLKGVMLSSLNILYPSESDTKSALKTLTSNTTSSDLTFRDAQDAVLASRNNILQICTFDYLHSLFGLTSFYLPI